MLIAGFVANYCKDRWYFNACMHLIHVTHILSVV